jgi:hypothetical protein
MLRGHVPARLFWGTAREAAEATAHQQNAADNKKGPHVGCENDVMPFVRKFSFYILAVLVGISINIDGDLISESKIRRFIYQHT